MTARWAIATVFGAVAYFTLITHLAIRSYPPMSDRLVRTARTFVAAFLGVLAPLVAGKLAAIKSISELSGLASTLAPLVVAAASAAFTAAMHVLVPPTAPTV